jgi:hypothetical protein
MGRIMRLHELGVTCRATESGPFCPQSAIGTSEAGMGCVAPLYAGRPTPRRRPPPTWPPDIIGTKSPYHFLYETCFDERHGGHYFP